MCSKLNKIYTEILRLADLSIFKLRVVKRTNLFVQKTRGS